MVTTPRIDVPDGADPLIHLWAGTGSALTMPAAALSDAVYTRGSLPLGVREAARVTVATVNQCRICLGLRADSDAATSGEQVLDDAFYDAVLAGDLTGLAPREALAAEFARRFATDHLGRTRTCGAVAGGVHRERAGRPGGVGGLLAGPGARQPGLRRRRVCAVPVGGLRPVG